MLLSAFFFSIPQLTLTTQYPKNSTVHRRHHQQPPHQQYRRRLPHTHERTAKMRVISATTAVMAGFCLLPVSSAVRPVRVPRAEPSTCDATCMRRFLYQTAFASGAAGVGMVMDAYDSAEWCVSDDNIDWCPDALNRTVSNIAGKLMDLTTIPSDPSDPTTVVKPEDLLYQMEEVSRQSAIHAMIWASRTVNGTTTLDNVTSHLPSNGSSSDAVRKIDWMINYLINNSTSHVNASALHAAMGAYQGPQANKRASAPPPAKTSASTPPSTNDGASTPPSANNGASRPPSKGDVAKKGHMKKDLLLGLGIPAAIFGPLLAAGAGKAVLNAGAGQAVLDPALSPAQSFLSQLMDGAASDSVLEEDSLLKWLTDLPESFEVGAPNPVNPNLTPQTWSDLWNSEAYREAYPFVPRKDWRVRAPPNSLKSLPLPGPEDTVKYWRSEMVDEKTATLKQELLEYAPDLDRVVRITKVGMKESAHVLGEQMIPMGNKPFRVLGQKGKPLMEFKRMGPGMRERVVWQKPEFLHPLPELTRPWNWAYAGESGAQMLLEGAPAVAGAGAVVAAAGAAAEAAPAALDSMGMPIVGLLSTTPGGLPELMTLAPTERAAGAAADTLALDVLNTAGERMVNFAQGNPVRIMYERGEPPNVRLSGWDQMFNFKAYDRGLPRKSQNFMRPEGSRPKAPRPKAPRPKGQSGGGPGQLDGPSDQAPSEEGWPEMSTAMSAPEVTGTPKPQPTEKPHEAMTARPEPATTPPPPPKSATPVQQKPAFSADNQPPVTVTVEHPTTVTNATTQLLTTLMTTTQTEAAATQSAWVWSDVPYPPGFNPEMKLPPVFMPYECTDGWQSEHKTEQPPELCARIDACDISDIRCTYYMDHVDKKGWLEGDSSGRKGKGGKKGKHGKKGRGGKKGKGGKEGNKGGYIGKGEA